jgi:vanillate O-demethylase ferredoxin subunit
MPATVQARLVGRVPLSSDVCTLTFEAPGPFGGLEPGAHVDLHLPGDLIRSYSLVDWDDSGRRMTVAVKEEPQGRGGSLAAHRLAVGDVVELGGPRNNFPLRPSALLPSEQPVVLLAGGIGVTPLYAMATALTSAGRPFELHYHVRSRDLAAFDGLLRALELGERYRLHCDDEDGFPDFWQLLADRPADTAYYVCGPELMLNAVLKAADELRRGVVHFERFAAAPPGEDVADEAFEIVLDRSGEVLTVPADRSILEVLRSTGRDVEYSCGEGTCGSCVLDVLDGDIDHRDGILTEEERAAGDCLCICVSRAAGPTLVLDL